VWTCDLGVLDVGEKRTIRITARPNETGLLGVSVNRVNLG